MPVPTPSLVVGDFDLILGSASPRRQELLSRLQWRFEVRVADVDEQIDERQDAAQNARRLARVKFDALASTCHDDVSAAGRGLLTADTLVSYGSVVLSKPSDRSDARRMLNLVSGRSIAVTTALCFGAPGFAEQGPATAEAVRQVDVRTTVELRRLMPAEITEYVEAGAADDKAGGLSLQDAASPFIAAVQGCWSNVIGLPLCAVTSMVTASASIRCTNALCGHAATG